MKKPFDVLAEGLMFENSRGDRTPLELFIACVDADFVNLARLLGLDWRNLPDSDGFKYCSNYAVGVQG